MKGAQSCPSLCNPMDYRVHGILQARILKWVAFPCSRALPNPGIEPRSPTLQEDSLPAEHILVYITCSIRSYVSCAVLCLVAQSCLTLCIPVDYRVHGILQARMLEWVAIPFFRGFSKPRDRVRVSYVSSTGRRILYPLCHLRSLGRRLLTNKESESQRGKVACPRSNNK